MKSKVFDIIKKAVGVESKPSGPGLIYSAIAAYNKARNKPHNAKYICHAPFSNMYFNVHGDCAPCWLTFLDPDSYPDKSIHDIWFGEKFQSIRDHLLRYDLTHKCNVCLKNLQIGNHTSVLARAYDSNEIAKYPTMLELELENTCNLECVMCIGELSSSIRRNRENLPPLKKAYDDKFADQLEEFIPHLKELRFNGGEPFLIDLVYKIFEKVERLNPGLKIVIATNGTILNKKVKTWLDRLNIHINFSLDSLTPEIYENIRVNARFERVIENFHFFRELTQERNRVMCVMVNPMRNNWHEMPEFIKFVNKHNLDIWFNTIHRPVEWAIWSLPPKKLTEVYSGLSKVEFEDDPKKPGKSSYNIGLYKNLVEVQIKNWSREAEERATVEKIQTPDAVDADIESVVKKKLTDFIYTHYNEGEEQKKQRLSELNAKLDKINELLKERNGDINFYGLIVQAPSDVLYTKLESRSVNSLVEDFENWFLQQSV